MFSHTQEAFGKYILHHIKNDRTGTGFCIVPALGGNVLDIRFQGISVLNGYRTPEELERTEWGKSVLLYPFPNRLKGGKYSWLGKTYQFPLNETNTQNALHGLGTRQPMNLIKVLTDDEQGTLECQYHDQGKHPYYPFPFHFSVAFTIRENAMEATFCFQNKGETDIPVGFGWHPYFSLSEKVDDQHLQLPELDQISIDERLIPTGQRQAFAQFKNLQAIGSTVLDNCFAVKNPEEGKINIRLQGEKGSINYWQETGSGRYNYVQLFTPSTRNSIAIEPMTCNVDAFNNQDGLIHLKPGASASARFGFSFEAG